jgi:hypothetical protein
MGINRLMISDLETTGPAAAAAAAAADFSFEAVFFFSFSHSFRFFHSFNFCLTDCIEHINMSVQELATKPNVFEEKRAGT